MPGKTAQLGVSLIEVLIAVVILSIGLLGLAGLQAGGMRVGQGSLYRGIAAQYAYDMADRMLANMPAVRAMSYNRSIGDPDPTGSSEPEVDLKDWLTRMRNALPAADGAVLVNSASSTVTVTVQWDDRRASVRDANPSAAQTATFAVTTQLWNK